MVELTILNSNAQRGPPKFVIALNFVSDKESVEAMALEPGNHR